MKKNKLKIGDIARELGIKKSIIRQWEQEFNLKTSENDKQHYSSEDMIVLKTIKDLIKTQGLSIDDAKKQLQQMHPAKKYIEKPKIEHSELPKATIEQTPITIIKKKSMTIVQVKSKPIVEKVEKKEVDPVVVPVEAKSVEIKEATEKKQELKPEITTDSKDVHHQLSSLKEKLLKFKKLLG